MFKQALHAILMQIKFETQFPAPFTVILIHFIFVCLALANGLSSALNYFFSNLLPVETLVTFQSLTKMPTPPRRAHVYVQLSDYPDVRKGAYSVPITQ